MEEEMDEMSTKECVELSDEEFQTEKELQEELGNVFEEDDEIFGSAEFEAEWDEECSEEMCEMNAAKIDTSLEDGSCIESDEKSMHLHFVDCIVLDDEKSDAFIAISCIEARLSAIRHHYPHLKHVIFQSDNVKNFAGKVTKMYLHQAPIAGGMTIVAYYHNEAAAGKDVCGSHFAHQQLRVEAYMYIAKGEWERKVSTPKQLAVALSTKCVKNTTVLLVKPKHDCPFMAAKLPPIKAISTYLAAHYDHHSETPRVSFFHNLGQSVPSYITKLIPAPFDSHDQDPFGNPGVKFSGCRVQFYNMDSVVDASKTRRR